MLIESQYTMTLATSSKGFPWSSPVYYIYLKPSFFFFSKPSSRHITDAMERNNAAASIYSNSSSWKDIRGVQMEGKIYKAGMNKDSAAAFKAYIKKFDFIKELSLSPVTNIMSIESAFKVRLYNFVPDTVYYLDNSIRFGFRETTKL